MRRGRFAVADLAGLFSLAIAAGLLCFVAKPALAGLQVASGEMASCAGGGFSVDLIATGAVGDVEASKLTSRAEVRLEEVLLGDRDYAGETLLIETNSGTNGGDAGAVSFNEGSRYEFYLQGEDDEWKTNICLGTRELTGSGASVDSPTIPETGGPSPTKLAAAGGLILAGIVVAYRWKRLHCG